MRMNSDVPDFPASPGALLPAGGGVSTDDSWSLGSAGFWPAPSVSSAVAVVVTVVGLSAWASVLVLVAQADAATRQLSEKIPVKILAVLLPVSMFPTLNPLAIAKNSEWKMLCK